MRLVHLVDAPLLIMNIVVYCSNDKYKKKTVRWLPNMAALATTTITVAHTVTANTVLPVLLLLWKKKYVSFLFNTQYTKTKKCSPQSAIDVDSNWILFTASSSLNLPYLSQLQKQLLKLNFFLWIKFKRKQKKICVHS